MDAFDYICEGQMSMFDIGKQNMFIDKPIRLIELFGGVGSQAMALRDIGANFTHWRLVEFDKYPVASYNAIHGTDFKPMDIREVKGSDLGIEDAGKKFCKFCKKELTPKKVGKRNEVESPKVFSRRVYCDRLCMTES